MNGVFSCALGTRRLAAATIGAVLVSASAWPAIAADPQADNAALRGYLDAGEFGPAMELARGAPTAAQRDAWLGQIAVAQAGLGARQSSLASAGEIGSDQARAETLSRAADEPLGGRGGGAQADFDSLIELITSTIRPTSWEDVGGPGSIRPFPTGVIIDPQGVLRPLLKSESGGRLAALRAAGEPGAGRQDDARRASQLRMISLNRLEKEAQLRLAAGQPLDETMQMLAGLQRIQYLFVYPESNDLVLAGPAGDWTTGAEEIPVSAQTGQPVVLLDDLVVVFRRLMSHPDASFGCRITPTQEALARVQDAIDASGSKPIKSAYARKQWLEKLRSQLGKQDIEVDGLDPRTRAAQVMVEADYRMKLVGMGLEDGVLGVKSYLDSIELAPGEAPPPMGVLRWWFTLDYDAVTASQDRQAFAIAGQGVKVMSENERLSAEGRQIHTGESDELNRQFAHDFSEHFSELCAKYPIYGELRNLCDLALAATIVREESLAGRVGWHLRCFSDPNAYPVGLGEAPKQVESVANCRVINGRTILAGVSGGVSVDPALLLRRQPMRVESYGKLHNRRAAAAPPKTVNGRGAWWWDAR
jgi:hypothetical protein